MQAGLIGCDLGYHDVMEINFQKIITSSDGGLNRIAFNTEEPVLVVGDTAGTIHSLKLSPNLRKKTKEIIRAAQHGSDREVRFSAENNVTAR